MEQILDLPVRRANGDTTALNEFKGKVLLLVNVASKCGLTPQYDGLEGLYEKYRDRGLMVVGFPANEFGAQEPGTNEEIQEFCRSNFGVKFPVMEKIVVRGEGIHPLYQTLTKAIPQAIKRPDSKFEKILKHHGLLTSKPGEITWNFEKFLVNRQGQVVGRFAPDITPVDQVLIDAIEVLLAE